MTTKFKLTALAIVAATLLSAVMVTPAQAATAGHGAHHGHHSHHRHHHKH